MVRRRPASCGGTAFRFIVVIQYITAVSQKQTTLRLVCSKSLTDTRATTEAAAWPVALRARLRELQSTIKPIPGFHS
eukprot:IDg1437t1